MSVRFLTPNPADSATLSPSSEAVGYPVENIQDKRLTKRWKTLSAGLSTIDDCETADWTPTNAPADALNAVTFKQGTKAIDLGKSGGGVTGSYAKAVTSTDMTNDHGGLWLYILDKTDFDSIEIRLGSSATDYFTITFLAAALTDNAADGDPWNDIVAKSLVALQDWAVGLGAPAIAAIDYAGIFITTANAGDTIASGRIIMDYWRGGIFDEYIEFDFTTAQAVTAGVIDGHDFDGTETDILLDSSTDASTWTNRATFTYGSKAMVAFITSVSARYWRIHYTKALTTESKEIGRVFLGTYIEPTRGIQLSGRRTLTDMSSVKRAFGGTQYSDIRNKFWELDFKITKETTAMTDTLRAALSDTIGLGQPIWLAYEPVVNPNGPWTIYGRFTRPWSESEPVNNYYDLAFKFAEDL